MSKIGLQAEGHEVWYRNWHIMELGQDGKPAAVGLARSQAARKIARGKVLIPASAGRETGKAGAIRIPRGEGLLDMRGRYVGGARLSPLPSPD